MILRVAVILAVILAFAGCSFPIPEGEQAHLDTAGKLESAQETKEAYRFYKEFVERYPASEQSDPALTRMYEIALGRSGTSWGYHRLKELLEQFPAAPLAGEAVFKVGQYEFESRQHDDAILTFKKLLGNYPESERLEAAVFLTGESELSQYEGADYESSPLRMAQEQYELLLRRFPSGAYVKRAKKRLRQISNELARRDYLLALYYERHGKPASAKVYLKSIVKEYPETEHARRAKKILDRIEGPEK